MALFMPSSWYLLAVIMRVMDTRRDRNQSYKKKIKKIGG
jgi:hypothetical protein